MYVRTDEENHTKPLPLTQLRALQQAEFTTGAARQKSLSTIAISAAEFLLFIPWCTLHTSNTVHTTLERVSTLRPIFRFILFFFSWSEYTRWIFFKNTITKQSNSPSTYLYEYNLDYPFKLMFCATPFSLEHIFYYYTIHRTKSLLNRKTWWHKTLKE